MLNAEDRMEEIYRKFRAECDEAAIPFKEDPKGFDSFQEKKLKEVIRAALEEGENRTCVVRFIPAVNPGSVLLRDKTKIVIKRDGNRAWLLRKNADPDPSASPV